MSFILCRTDLTGPHYVKNSVDRTGDIRKAKKFKTRNEAVKYSIKHYSLHYRVEKY